VSSPMTLRRWFSLIVTDGGNSFSLGKTLVGSFPFCQSPDSKEIRGRIASGCRACGYIAGETPVIDGLSGGGEAARGRELHVAPRRQL
jgi:hypothetical protein